MRKIECEAWQGVHLTIDFSVMNVSRPILSVGALVKKGFDVSLGACSYLRLGTRMVPLLRKGNLFFLPVCLPGTSWTEQQKAMLSVTMPAVEKILVAPVYAPRRTWSLVEWGSDTNCLMAGWFAAHQQLSERLTLPRRDLKRPERIPVIANLVTRMVTQESMCSFGAQCHMHHGTHGSMRTSDMIGERSRRSRQPDRRAVVC
jgi:hypothetical protein